MATYTVKKGDCLWSIAKRYLGSGTRWTELADINGISRGNPTIYVGQVIKLDTGGTAAPARATPQPVVQSRPTIQYFGLQAGSDKTVFATWYWERANTDHYEIWWEYDTGNGVWFVANTGTVQSNIKQATYTAPSNAVGVQFWVKPVAQTHDVNGSEISYWNGEWSTAKQYYFSANPPATPTNVSIEIDKYRLTAKAQYTSTVSAAGGIQFQIVKDNEVIFNTGNAALKTTIASYSCNVTAGGEYKVRCRAYRGNLYSDWTEYSSSVATIPPAPTGITTIRAASETSVYLEWPACKTAKTYEIEYATKLEYFDGSDKTQTVTGIEYTHYQKTGMDSGEEYFFRVRATNDKGTSAWTAIKSIIIGKKPAAPTTWSSTTTAIVGEPLNLYWVHNSQDGSSETYAEIELYIDGTKKSISVKKSTDEEEKDKTYG